MLRLRNSRKNNKNHKFAQDEEDLRQVEPELEQDLPSRGAYCLYLKAIWMACADFKEQYLHTGSDALQLMQSFIFNFTFYYY